MEPERSKGCRELLCREDFPLLCGRRRSEYPFLGWRIEISGQLQKSVEMDDGQFRTVTETFRNHYDS